MAGRGERPVHTAETRWEAFERLREEALMRPRPPTWGRRPRTHLHRRRGRQANPPGSAILWPFARFPRRDIAPFSERLVIVVDRTGDANVDMILDALETKYKKIQELRQNIYERKAIIPRDPDLFSMRTAMYWEIVDELLDKVAELRGAILTAGFEAPAVPDHFLGRF